MDAIWLLTSGVVIHPARDDDDGNVVAAISQQIEQVLAVGLAGHVQVEQDQINRLPSRICSASVASDAGIGVKSKRFKTSIMNWRIVASSSTIRKRALVSVVVVIGSPSWRRIRACTAESKNGHPAIGLNAIAN